MFIVVASLAAARSRRRRGRRLRAEEALMAGICVCIG
jgi:hypothetical protein